MKDKRKFRIYLVEQIDSLPFNRGALANIGFIFSQFENCNSIAIQDINMVSF